MPKIKVTEELLRYFIDNFPNKTNRELAKEMGLARSSICRLQQKYNLHKSSEHIHNMGVRAGKASSKATGGKVIKSDAPETIAKRAATYRKTWKSEYARYKWGLPQLTRIRLKKEPRAKKDQRNNLLRRGYIIDEQNLIAYYTEATERSRKLENRSATSKLRIYYKFKPYGGLDKRSDEPGQ